MYGIFTYIWVISRANVGKYSIHGAYGTGKQIHEFHGVENEKKICVTADPDAPWCWNMHTYIYPKNGSNVYG